MKFEYQYERFSQSLIRSQYADRTVENYLSQLRKFKAFLQEYYPDRAVDPKRITKEIILGIIGQIIKFNGWIRELLRVLHIHAINLSKKKEYD